MNFPKLDSKVKIAIIGLLVTAITTGAIAYGANYVFPASNLQTGTVNPTPSPSPSPSPSPTPLTVNTGLLLSPTVVTVGSTWTLTATLDHPLAGIIVNFYEGTSVATGTLVGNSVTDANGIATLTLTATIGSHTYIAQPQ